MSKLLCIYHGNCADGFGAAWVVRKALGDRVEFHPGIYGHPAPNVGNRHVLMVDFSYKRPLIELLARQARSILILDHHKTAAEDLAGFREPAPYAEWKDRTLAKVEGDPEPVAALFDMDRSGAGMTWDFFFPDKPRPALINHIEDRDLWLFKLDGTREIQASIFSFPYDFDVWDKLMESPVELLRSEGAAIERKHHKDIGELVGVTKRRMVIGGYDIPVANLPYTLTSDAGHLMAKGEPFAACYWDTPAGRVFSLRSTDEGVDVSLIAKAYGGGGHRNASGFQASRGWEGDPSN